MTELTPPPGKVWLMLECTQHEWDTGDFEYADLEVVDTFENEPEDPSDKCNRLLAEAESEFRKASSGFQIHKDIGSGVPEASNGFRYLADALKVLREEL